MVRLFGPPDVEDLRDRGRVKALAKAARYPGDATIRADAIEALGAIGDAEAVPALVAALADESPQVREEAARALGRVGAEGSVDDLLHLLAREQVQSVAGEVVASLRRLGDVDAVGPVLDVVRQEADAGLRTVVDRLDEILGRGPGLEEVDLLYRVARGRSPGPRDSRLVLQALVESREIDSGVGREAARAIARSPGPDGAAFLVVLLQGSDAGLQAVALDALVAAGWEPETDPDRAVWLVARGEARGLLELDEDSVQPVLAEMMHGPVADADWLTRGAVAMILLRSDREIDASTRVTAEMALGELTDGYHRLLVQVFGSGGSTVDGSVASHIFGDYGDLILDSAGGVSSKAVEDLCLVDTPASTNVLHLVAEMEDVTTRRTVEVEYDLDHPSGDDVVVTTHSCERQRDMARRELTSRGDPPYDVSAYRSPDCWRLPQ